LHSTQLEKPSKVATRACSISWIPHEEFPFLRAPRTVMSVKMHLNLLHMITGHVVSKNSELVIVQLGQLEHRRPLFMDSDKCNV
jgi:hypothetical protein